MTQPAYLSSDLLGYRLGAASAPHPGRPLRVLPAPSLELGDLVVDRAYRLAEVAGRPLDLTYLEFELLAHLAEYPRLVFTRAQLLDHVWGYGGVAEHDGGGRTVDVHVARLRSKLGRDRRHWLQTVRKVGYRLVPDTS